MTKSNEVYTFLIRSIDGRQQTATENKVITYTINWESVLPKKYKSFRAVGYIRVVDDAKNNAEYVFVKVSSLSPKLFDTETNGKTSYLCVGKQYDGNSHKEYYNLEVDMEGLKVDYPTTNECTIEMRELDGTLQDVGDYFLWIQFHPIE